MNNYTALINNLDALELVRIKENIGKYIDIITDGSKTSVDALYELTQMEISFSMEAVIKGNVKVANFPFLKEINQFDFGFQLSIGRKKVMGFMTLRFIERVENIIFCGSHGVGKTNLAVSISIIGKSLEMFL